MIVMDEDKCMVDVARFFMEFCVDESCGKCTPCRVGTRQMLNILTRICNGQGKEGDIEDLEKWAAIVQNTALCGLGQTAPNPVLSTLRYFRDEYEAHIKEKRCPAVACTAMFKSPCQHACPLGMDVPAYVALVRAERLEEAYRVLLRTNPSPASAGGSATTSASPSAAARPWTNRSTSNTSSATSPTTGPGRRRSGPR